MGINIHPFSADSVLDDNDNFPYRKVISKTDSIRQRDARINQAALP
jgi:hypothetical protein